MTQTTGPIDTSITDAKQQLARLGVQTEAMQALLVRLLQDVVHAESRLDDNQAARIVEASEQLVLSALASQADAEEAAQALKDAAQPALLDALTGLPNRMLLVDRVGQAIAHARHHDARVALLLLQLDNLRPLIDAHGHAFGNKVLRLAADRLRAAAREVDTVSRLAGDAFVILLSEPDQPGEALAAAEALIAAVGAPAQVEGQPVALEASICIARYPDDGEDFDTLVARADTVLQEARRKRAGNGTRHGNGAIAEVGRPAAGSSPDDQPALLAARQRLVEADRERRQLTALREANEKLVLVAISEQELRAAAELAQHRQTALMAAVADELRNPIAPIRIANAMLGRLPTDTPLLPRVQRIVEQQLTEISRLVGNLVDASNLESGSLKLDRHRVDLCRIIDAAVAVHRPRMDARGQRFEMQRPAGALEVNGDAARLEQVISNLLDNASRFTHDDGRIGLSVVADGGTVTLTVSDSGIGITPQMLPRLFEPFVQDTQALGFSGIGLGIGLTVARTLARAHGGDVVAHSAGINRGSQFVVTLPLAARERAVLTAVSTTGASAPQR